MNIYLFSFIDSRQPLTLYHFLKYYCDYLKIENVKIILHTEEDDENRKECLEYLNKYDIIPTLKNKYSSYVKKEYVNNFINELNNDDWLIYPDSDEFFDFPYNDLNKFLNYCDEKNINIVRGAFNDRISENYELKKIKKEESIWKQYPYEITNYGISKYFGSSYIKICACKAKYQYWNSHFLIEEIENHGGKKHDPIKKIENGILVENKKYYLKYYEKILKVHHFRCCLSLFDKLKVRVNLMGNYSNHISCINFYRKVFDNIILKDDKKFLKIPYDLKKSIIKY